MRSLTPILLLALLAAAPALYSQPWQWQSMQGDYYNPSGFPQPDWRQTQFTEAIADFNGDGRDEFFDLTAGGFRIATRDTTPGPMHWTVFEGTQDLSVGQTFAADLDSDAVAELVIFSSPVHVWKAVSFDPWTWETRDGLLSRFPSMMPVMMKATLGDYDGDGVENCFFWWLLGGEADVIFLYRRLAGGGWSADSMLHTEHLPFSTMCQGDFDHDGHLDFAFTPYITDASSFSVFSENLHPGMVFHDLDSTLYHEFSGPAGGDLDGDGQWEGLYYWPPDLGYRMVEVEHDSVNFLRTVSSQSLGRASGPLFGNFQTRSGTIVGAVHSYPYGDPFIQNDAFELLTYRDSTWEPIDIGFHDDPDYQCVGGNMADLDGDGLKDIFSVLYDHGDFTDRYMWSVWKNIGRAQADSFSREWRQDAFWARHFIMRTDTVFSSPQIGEINGDGRAELAVLAQPQSGARRVLFYEMLGQISDTNYVQHSEWSTGLPTGLLAIRLADIDNDGLAEVIGKTTGNEESGHWEAYFRRNGTWIHYANILPDFSAPNISFVDVNLDGNLDLSTPTDIWLSMTPSKAKDPFILPPSSFLLSAFPNPFNPTTEITYTVPVTGRATIKVFDILGQQVRVLQDEFPTSGKHRVLFDGGQLPAGIYFLRLVVDSDGVHGLQREAASHQRTLKLVLLK